MSSSRAADPYLHETDEILYNIIIDAGGLYAVVNDRRSIYNALNAYNSNNANGEARFGTACNSPTRRRAKIRNVLDRLFWKDDDGAWGPTFAYVANVHGFGLVDESITDREQRSSRNAPPPTRSTPRSTPQRHPTKFPQRLPPDDPPTPRGVETTPNLRNRDQPRDSAVAHPVNQMVAPESPVLSSIRGVPPSPYRGLLTNLSSQGSLDSATRIAMAFSLAEDETRARNDMMQAHYDREENAARSANESVINNFIEKSHQLVEKNLQPIELSHQLVQTFTEQGDRLCRSLAQRREASQQHCDDTLNHLSQLRSSLLQPRSASNSPPASDYDEAKPAALPQRDGGKVGANGNGKDDQSELETNEEAAAADEFVGSPVARRVRGRQDSDSEDGEEQSRVRKDART